MLQDGLHSGLEAAERCHILGLFAGNAPVVGLVERLVVFPDGLVVHGEPLDWLCGEGLIEGGEGNVNTVC